VNCNQAQELLPLLAGRDLEEKQATLVAAHVESCEECAHSAEEYREAQHMVRLYAPPPFSEEDYAGMRRSVLREIERGPTAFTVPALIGGLFRPRIRWAIATALMLAVSVFAFYFMANRKNDAKQIVINGGDASPSSEEAPSNPPAADQPLPLSAPPHTPLPGKVFKAGGGTSSPNKHNRLMFARVSPRAPIVAQPDTSDVPAFSEKTTRVEIQTKDPNIRIIWFSPRPTKRDAPNKSSRRNQEARSNA
jgi:hypothetical protein